MDRTPVDTGRIFTASALVTLSTVATEIFTLLASSLSRVEIISLEMQQNSTLPQAMSVEMFRTTAAALSTGAAITPANRNGWPTAPAGSATVTGNSTTLNSTAAATRVFAGGFEVNSGRFRFAPALGPIVDSSQRFSARISAPSTATGLTLAASLSFREVGRIPS